MPNEHRHQVAFTLCVLAFGHPEGKFFPGVIQWGAALRVAAPFGFSGRARASVFARVYPQECIRKTWAGW
jgi:hypothetical protein